MSVSNPQYLWFLLIVPVFVYAAVASYRSSSAWLYRFAGIEKKTSSALGAIGSLGIALLLSIVSIAEPKVQYTRTVFNRSGIDIAIGIDVSKSMLAEDEVLPQDNQAIFTIPNRLNRARSCALEIISELRGERVGVFIFASRGVEIVPLTSDYGYCQYLLKHINDLAITIPGSDLSQAIMTGTSMLEGTPASHVKVLILISDGEDIGDDPAAPVEAAGQAASKGVILYTLGTGRGSNVLIPIRSPDGNAVIDYYRDQDKTPLKTRLEQDALKAIAAAGRGGYFRPSEGSCGEQVVTSFLQHAQAVEYTKRTELAWFDLSPVLLAFGLMSFCLGAVLNQR